MLTVMMTLSGKLSYDFNKKINYYQPQEISPPWPPALLGPGQHQPSHGQPLSGDQIRQQF